jgi:hypothetical protein
VSDVKWAFGMIGHLLFHKLNEWHGRFHLHDLIVLLTVLGLAIYNIDWSRRGLLVEDIIGRKGGYLTLSLCIDCWRYIISSSRITTDTKQLWHHLHHLVHHHPG